MSMEYKKRAETARSLPPCSRRLIQLRCAPALNAVHTLLCAHRHVAPILFQTHLLIEFYHPIVYAPNKSLTTCLRNSRCVNTSDHIYKQFEYASVHLRANAFGNTSMAICNIHLEVSFRRRYKMNSITRCLKAPCKTSCKRTGRSGKAAMMTSSS